MRRNSAKTLHSILNQLAAKMHQKLGDFELYLFGSHSKGDWIEDSDIDLIIVSDRFRSLNVGERARLVRGLAPDNIPFDLILYTHEEFKRAKKSLSMKDVIDSCIKVV